jgi:hypothetical protein
MIKILRGVKMYLDLELAEDIELIRAILYEMLEDNQYDFLDTNILSANRILNSFIVDYYKSSQSKK